MILSRLRYRPVTVPLQLLGLRYLPLPFWTNVTQGYPALWTVTQALPNVTSVTERYKRFRTLQSVTERYRALHTEFTDFGEFK
jgi:hypothetical protein